MNDANRQPLEIPDSLQSQLKEFRRRVWIIKTIEAVGGALFGFALAYVIVFGLDRLGDTPAVLRLLIFGGAILVCATVPLALHRWIWRNRRLEQLARLLSKRFPSIGDQLLGIIELVRDDFEQTRSRALCEAAVKQVAETALTRNFAEAIPNPRHRRAGILATVGISSLLVLGLAFPDAAKNAWARFLMPWSDTPRYTFTKIKPLQNPMVVAHGEPFSLQVQLQSDSQRHPSYAQVQVGRQPAIQSSFANDAVEFQLPGLLETTDVIVTVGDYSQQIRVEPTLRPELVSLVAHVNLPAYLERDKSIAKDVRGGNVTLVKGSRASFVATVSRELAEATIDGQQQEPQGKQITTGETAVDDSRRLEIRWRDSLGLDAKEPFTLGVNGREDDAPTLSCDDLPRQKVVLDTETLKFQVNAQDDFGIKKIGVEWQGMDSTTVKTPAKGERILAAGGPDKDTLSIGGTFSAQSLGIEPQPVQVRIFAEDFLPGRERTYSATYVLYVLNAEQHAIWLTEQLSKWHRQSLEVRDKELQLYETNRELRDLTNEELNRPETQRRLDAQAVAERANGRRLSNLVNSGEDLIQQASRNPEFGVGHLEKWAEMLQILKDISGNRMPSVADLLKQAAAASASSQSKQSKMAGQNRGPAGGSPGEEDPNADKKKGPAVPQVVDVESSQQPLDTKKSSDSSPSKSGSGSLRLPTTMLAGGGAKSESCPAGDKLDEAITQQQDLLAEFDKISDELNRILANLEGSTLVKRLKAASRQQYKIGGRIADNINSVFGAGVASTDDSTAKLFSELAKQEAKSSHDSSVIMDDLQAYYERRRFSKFKVVLDDMRSQDVIGGLRQLGDDLHKEHGLSIAQCDYWSDNFDRWAEDLVDPASGGT